MMETSKQEQEAVIELRRVCDRLRISNDIFREALDFYKNWLSRVPKIRSLATEKSVIAGCLLVALKVHRELISKDEIAGAFNENVMGVALASHVICRVEGISESISSQFSAGKDNLKTAVDVIGTESFSDTREKTKRYKIVFARPSRAHNRSLTCTKAVSHLKPEI